MKTQPQKRGKMTFYLERETALLSMFLAKVLKLNISYNQKRHVE